MRVHFPDVLTLDESCAQNPIRQVRERRAQRDGELPEYKGDRLRGYIFRPTTGGGEVLIVPKNKQVPAAFKRVLQATVLPNGEVADLSDGQWLRHPLLERGADIASYEAEVDAILKSWQGAFSYAEEDPAKGIVGLRSPQIGAVHAIHAHWTTSDTTATIVMPTGTGKTETMLSILVSARCRKLLVVVPTDALRSQIARKFETLGILTDPSCAVLRADARHPIVCTLEHMPRDVVAVDEIFGRAQVIVTTSSIAGKSSAAVQERMAHHCPYLFIDEAHHAEAPTWSAFKQRFKSRRTVQFTATPFREDGKLLDGTIIFKYPLKKAQQEGYFKPIKFESVVEFNQKKSDEAIAERAIQRLRADTDKGHILMARVDSITRAKKVFEIYNKYPEFKPVQLHTQIKSTKRREALRQVMSGESRIIVCVDMLGEGFDMPELKIAAFHDIRRTLAVTLQLAGRFTRSKTTLGDATFIANTADVDVQDELRKLYTRDPDWNILLPQLSDSMIGEQLSLQEFLQGFTEFTKEIPLKTVRPATSTVVYKTTCTDWTPEKYRAGIPGVESCQQLHEAINHAKHTLIVVAARRLYLPWADLSSLYDWQWELCVVFWSKEQNLLFINSSTNAGEFEGLARAVAGDTATLIKGQDVFRTFAGVNRLRLQNVGLTEYLGRNVRYTGRMGADIEPALLGVQRHKTQKSVLSGSGFEDGEKATVGASRKGRIWSHRRDRVDQLLVWCKKIGAKILNTAIDPDEILKGTLDAKRVRVRPDKMPIMVDWPEEMYTEPEKAWAFIFGTQERPLSDVNIELVTPSQAGSIRFAVVSEEERAEFELELTGTEENPNFQFKSTDDVKVRRGERADAQPASDFFYHCPPMIWFADGSSLEGDQYVELKGTHQPYDSSKISAWDWTGVDLKIESQGTAKAANSIQARVIQKLVAGDYAMIVDDDNKGEAADVVAVRLVGDQAKPSKIEIEFYHCKYSQEATPGQRIGDLYEVCGQAQKSIAWMASPEKLTDLFTHLLRREQARRDASLASRYEKGTDELLHTIREMSRLCETSLKIHIVQPGVSKSRVTRPQLELMSVTENHLWETYQIGFGVIVSS